MVEQDYKWVIVYDAEFKAYRVTGYVSVNGKWTQDGARVSCSYMSAALEHIDKSREFTNRAIE